MPNDKRPAAGHMRRQHTAFAAGARTSQLDLWPSQLADGRHGRRPVYLQHSPAVRREGQAGLWRAVHHVQQLFGRRQVPLRQPLLVQARRT